MRTGGSACTGWGAGAAGAGREAHAAVSNAVASTAAHCRGRLAGVADGVVRGGELQSGCIREFDPKKRVRSILDKLHSATMGHHIFLHDGQPDPGAAHRVLGLAYAPVKGLEDAVPVPLGHTRPLV